MKNRALIITNIIILCCIIIGLLIFMIWGIGSKHSFWDFKNELLYSKTYNMEDITKIKTDLRSYDIELKEANDNNFKVEIYGNEKNKDNIKVDINNKNLTIEQKGSSICFGFCYSNNVIVIYVPESFNNELDINTISGNIDIYVDVLKANLKTTSGDIKMQNIKYASINTTSGNIKLEEVKEANINTVSGDVMINSSEKVEVKTTSGDIKILEASEKIFINTTSGDVTVRDFTINSDSKVHTVSGEVNINLRNEADIKVDTRSGDKDIKNTNGEYKLDIKTTSGDITVM